MLNVKNINHEFESSYYTATPKFLSTRAIGVELSPGSRVGNKETVFITAGPDEDTASLILAHQIADATGGRVFSAMPADPNGDYTFRSISYCKDNMLACAIVAGPEDSEIVQSWMMHDQTVRIALYEAWKHTMLKIQTGALLLNASRKNGRSPPQRFQRK